MSGKRMSVSASLLTGWRPGLLLSLVKRFPPAVIIPVVIPPSLGPVATVS